MLLQPKLNLRVSQRQILTPGLVQMVSVLALNKLELRDMINAEMVENPVLEEMDEAVPLLDDAARKEEERTAPEENTVAAAEKKDPFEEIDFGSFFQEYLDPGFRSRGEMEEVERPSFENFLSKPGNLTDHLMWQLGSLPTSPEVRAAAEVVIGNLNEDGYLIASDEEMLGIVVPAAPEADAAVVENVAKEAMALGIHTDEIPVADDEGNPEDVEEAAADATLRSNFVSAASLYAHTPSQDNGPAAAAQRAPEYAPEIAVNQPAVSARLVPKVPPPKFNRTDLHEAIAMLRTLDPPGVACRDLRECLLCQLQYQQQLAAQKEDAGEDAARIVADSIAVVDQHLRAVQNKQFKEISRAIGRPVEVVMAALEYIRTLDPRPGLRYNIVQPRLIEPDVAFVKHGEDWLVIMNDDDVPQLRLNPAYKRLLNRDTNDKDTRNYVKDRYKSAMQLIKNIEQRKQTIMKVCYSIVTRQPDFLERGIDHLKPMMIKEVAEEIGVHPSTVSRAVANKYVHTPQGVFELRYFFSESVNGPEGGGTSLLILKRRVKKLIEDEDPARPLTDEQITRILQSQGIQVTRRTVAKYREDMRIPSTHQRRVKK